MGIRKKYIGHTSHRGFTIAKTIFGFWWIGPDGKICNAGTPDEWEAAQNWPRKTGDVYFMEVPKIGDWIIQLKPDTVFKWPPRARKCDELTRKPKELFSISMGDSVFCFYVSAKNGRKAVEINDMQQKMIFRLLKKKLLAAKDGALVAMPGCRSKVLAESGLKNIFAELNILLDT